MTKPITYISGPMRGYPEMNFPAFRAAKELLAEKGHGVVSPVDIGETLDGGGKRVCTSQEYLRADLYEILAAGCDGMALLPGWEKSVGARCEAAIGVSLGFTFYNERGARIPAPQMIEIRGGYERPVELPADVAAA